MDARRLKELLTDIENNPSPTDGDIQFAGAVCSILSYYGLRPEVTPHERRDVAPNSLVDELLQDLLTAFVAYMDGKAKYQATPTENNKAAMLQKLDGMLDLLRQIFDNLWRESDAEEEHERIKIFFTDYAKKHNL